MHNLSASGSLFLLRLPTFLSPRSCDAPYLPPVPRDILLSATPGILNLHQKIQCEKHT